MAIKAKTTAKAKAKAKGSGKPNPFAKTTAGTKTVTCPKCGNKFKA